MVPAPSLLLFWEICWLRVKLKVRNRTETLGIGSRGPDFSLEAANRDGVFSLGGLLQGKAVILEFLRGTW